MIRVHYRYNVWPAGPGELLYTSRNREAKTEILETNLG